MSRRRFAVLLVVYLLLRIDLGMVTGDQDSQTYQDWAYGIASSGLAMAYERTGVDYPPLVLYVFHPIGKVYQYFVPTFDPERIHRSVPFVLLIKAPHLVFDLLLAGLIYWLVAVGGLWRSARAGPAWGRFAALLYLWNPAVLWGSAYWGQLDSIHTALAVASLAALGYRRLASSGGLLAASGLMKPLAAPLAPLLVVAVAARRGLRGLVRTGAGGLAVGALVLLPFLASGRVVAVVERVLGDLGAMAFTSANSHNLWMMLGSWEPSTRAVLGPLSPQAIGLLLFSGACLPLLVRSWSWLGSEEMEESAYLARLFLLAAAVYSSFFFFSANMHENHLFLSVPLLLLVAGRSRALAWLAIGCTVAVFLNMVIHDVDLPYRLPWVLSERSPVLDPYLVFDRRMNPVAHAYGQDLHYTWLQLGGIAWNTLLVVAVVGATYLTAWRSRV